MPSSVQPVRDSSVRFRVVPPEVTIHDWAVRDRPLGSSVALTMTAGASWLAAWAMDNVLVGLVVAAALGLVAWRTWLPVRYDLSASGVTQSVFRWRRRIPWTAVVRHELRGGGVLLLADANVTPLSPLRGLYLHWGKHRADVLAHVEYYLQSWTATDHAAHAGQQHAAGEQAAAS